MDAEGARTYILQRLRSELPSERSYHSLAHTLDVYASAIDIAEREGIEGEDLTLLKVAALFHDAGFVISDRDHEEASCSLVREHLPRFAFTGTQVERICELIDATRIPQSPKDLVAEVLCDADLDYLGRADFVSIGDLLFAEMRAYGVLSTEQEWNELQERFLSRHRYFTTTNRAQREPVKQKHLADVRAWLARRAG
ncbi:MAG: HD domain-containing protein [Flavobacteriales bacterium]